MKGYVCIPDTGVMGKYFYAMTKGYFFIDEFGTNSLNIEKQGTTSHFVYCAIGISEENIDHAREMRDLISTKYFQGRTIKSSSVGNNKKGFEKRLQVIEELLKLNFYIFTLVVDKSKIDSVGLKEKESILQILPANIYSKALQ
ncbi:hypothetical protein LVD15_23380 [Fulvivirga maritima]|uniref:DUF3800 domain-containing protein n=1 Tax=Fulvivirga maritima TaxID=2904247 RepID=UPI001F3DF296|nr:hypothetical protein [Fulvivirga maritima]UII26210.1 hypothetical protein LVD15_23380 [Fulvivirga maritima]